MVETTVAQGYCGNCGKELNQDNVFCTNCGHPLHQTARVSTPEADIPTSPPPLQDESTAASLTPQDPLTPQDQGKEIKAWWQTLIGKMIGIFVAIFIVLSALIVLIALVDIAGGEETGSQADKVEKSQGAQNAQEPGSG